jgi:hypothetical protein
LPGSYILTIDILARRRRTHDVMMLLIGIIERGIEESILDFRLRG